MDVTTTTTIGDDDQGRNVTHANGEVMIFNKGRGRVVLTNDMTMHCG